ncbi:MAG: molybdopterin-dependent oxidoreductase [Thermoleophilia bacterium]|nr:molybdopterin-dependent oxidoreductase [Thermoleophilia bacterium]
MADIDSLIAAKIPRPETGIEIRKSICTICDPTTQCGLDCYVKDGRIIKVEGSREHPQNRGTLCAKGAAQRQWVYHKDRLLRPLKRVGPRGSGKMTPISWDEALSTVAENLLRLRDSYGPESVIFYCGYPKHPRPFLKRLAHQFGSPNLCTESSTCFTAMAMAWQLVFGHMGSPDLPTTRCLVIWTSNPAHSRPLSARGIKEARDRGVKLIVVDPRLSPTAALADLHLRLRPGTDGALALAMAHVIIEEGLYDQEFVARWTRGFEEFRAYVAQFPPHTAETITGVPATLIAEAARLYATTRPAALMTSAAPVVQNTNGLQNQRAAICLVALTGNFDIPGGNVVAPSSWLEVSGAGFVTREHEFAQARPWSEMAPRIGADRFPLWAQLFDQAQSMAITEQLETDTPYPLRGLVAFGLNHRMWPDPPRLLRAMEKLEFIVDVDLFGTDTSKYADIVLPACSSVERSELRAYPQRYVVFTQPVIPPLGESRPDIDIIFALAARLGLVDPLLNPSQSTQDTLPGQAQPIGAPDYTTAYENALDWILAPSGLALAELKKHPGGMAVPNPLPTEFKKYENYGFATPSGKAEFVSSLLEKFADRTAHDPLPVYREPALSPVSTPEVAVHYPLILGTGTRLPMFIHSRTFRLSWTRSLRPAAAADLHPHDAERLGIISGDLIEISTPLEAIKVTANVTHMAYPGAVHMFHDYPEADVNSLIPADYLDPISGFPGYKALLCQVRKVGPAEATDVGEAEKQA